MDEKKLKQKYGAKGKDSFKTKLNLFLFNEVVNNGIIDESNFSHFEITNSLIKQYTNEYWQQPTDYEINKLKIAKIDESISKWKEGNTQTIKELETHYITYFKDKVYPFEDFIKLFDRESCYYCGISESEIEKLGDLKKLNKKSLRGWSLEIERFDSNLEYHSENCTLACYWCNNAKTDEFTKDEFKRIGEEFRKIWESRLGGKLKNEISSK
jgi:hypothetical protein